MKNKYFIIFLSFLLLNACSENTSEENILTTEELPKIEENYLFADSLINRNKELLKKNNERGIGVATPVYNQAHNGPIGHTIEYPDGTTEYRSNLQPMTPYNWFTNDTLQETIVLRFEIGGNKLHYAFHFLNEKIPLDMINEMNTLQTSLNGLIEYDSIDKSYIHDMIDNSTELNQFYFKTTSSIKIGDKTNKIYDIYGKPKEQVANVDGYKKLKWFNNSLKQEVIIYSKNEIINGIMILNKNLYDN